MSRRRSAGALCVVGSVLAGVLGSMLLAGCANDGRSLALPAGLSSSLTADTPPTATAAPATGSGAAKLAGTATLQLGGKQVEVTSVELDTQCSALVRPFDPSDNITELSKLVAEMAAEVAVAQAGDSLQKALGMGSSSAKPVGSRHNITLSVRRAALRMNWLPMALETMYGQSLLDQMRGELVGRDDKVGTRLYPQADALLAEVLAAVGEPSGYQFKLFIRADAGENAMALPGGFLVIDKALVADPKLRNKAYFAVAHEVAHVLQRHQTRAVQARIIDAVSLQKGLPDLIKTVQASHSEPKAVLALFATGKRLFEKHYEGQELQSDACAVRLLDSTFKDNRRLRTVLSAFVAGLPRTPPAAPPAAGRETAQNLDNLGDMVLLVSRPIDQHPTAEARLANLRMMLAEVEKRPLPADPAAKPLPKVNLPKLPTLPQVPVKKA